VKMLPQRSLPPEPQLARRQLEGRPAHETEQGLTFSDTATGPRSLTTQRRGTREKYGAVLARLPREQMT